MAKHTMIPNPNSILLLCPNDSGIDIPGDVAYKMLSDALERSIIPLTAKEFSRMRELEQMNQNTLGAWKLSELVGLQNRYNKKGSK